jgi:hypothetical protein
MKNILLVGLFLLFGASALAQNTFELKDASKYFDIKISVAGCENGSCTGKASFTFFKKGGTTPYQVINLSNTYVELGDEGSPKANITRSYDDQSVINIDDFNFDGMEDVAICNGNGGSYGMPSYQIYLSSRSAGKFVYNKAFSELGEHLGMFEEKVLRIFDKSGCCWHVVEEYRVAGGRPVKIFVEEEDATVENENQEGKVKITTKRLVKGKWQTRVRYKKVG